MQIKLTTLTTSFQRRGSLINRSSITVFLISKALNRFGNPANIFWKVGLTWVSWKFVQLRYLTWSELLDVRLCLFLGKFRCIENTVEAVSSVDDI